MIKIKTYEINVDLMHCDEDKILCECTVEFGDSLPNLNYLQLSTILKWEKVFCKYMSLSKSQEYAYKTENVCMRVENIKDLSYEEIFTKDRLDNYVKNILHKLYDRFEGDFIPLEDDLLEETKRHFNEDAYSQIRKSVEESLLCVLDARDRFINTTVESRM